MHQINTASPEENYHLETVMIDQFFWKKIQYNTGVTWLRKEITRITPFLIKIFKKCEDVLIF